MKRVKRVLLASLWWHDELMRGVARHAARHGWHLSLQPILYGKIPIEWHGDGILAQPGPLSSDIKRLLRRLRCPAVAFGIGSPDIKAPRVAIDSLLAGQMAAEHFLERGFRHFAYYSLGTADAVTPLFDAFKDTAQTCARSFSDMRPKQGQGQPRIQSWVNLHRSLCKQLRTLPKPLAIFATPDNRAVEVIEACQSEGLAIPNDVAILGMLDMPLFRECSTVPLSSVSVNFNENARLACDLLNQMMNGATPPKDPILVPPTGIAVRTSTDTLAADSEEVGRAISFMFEHISEPISVPDICKATGISRTSLFFAFNRDLAKPPGCVLTHIRLLKAQTMLKETETKVETISDACGFGDRINMYHHFRRQLGMSPAAYRKKHQSK